MVEPYAQRSALTPVERDALMTQLLPMVKRTAQRIARRVPDRVDVNDLISAGCVALLSAMDRFDPSRGKTFAAFAEWRVKGAILDELRGLDHMTRHQRLQLNQILRARRKLEKEGRPGDRVEPAELAAETGLPLELVEELLERMDAPGFVSLGELGVEREEVEVVLRSLRGGQVSDPYLEVYLGDLKKRMVRALKELPPKEKLVLSLYYVENLTYKEIGAVLDRTESRICQLHRQAIELLREKLDEIPLERPRPRPRPLAEVVAH